MSGTKKRGQKLCQNCKTKQTLYVCPRCHFGSCSLHCCQAHKKAQNCNGKRDKTAFKRLRDMTDSDIRSDYHFLEEIVDQTSTAQRLLRGTPSSKRMRSEADASSIQHELLQTATKSEMSRRFQTTNKKLQQHAQLHNITVHSLPSFMERHQQNKSGTRNNKVFYWTVEWKFCTRSESSEISLMSETMAIREELGKLFGEQQIDLKGYFLFLKKLPCPNNKPVYISVSPDSTLKEILRSQTVIEFPTIYIVPEQKRSEFPTLLQTIE